MKKLTQTQLIIFTTLFLLFFDNYSFFNNVLKIYPLEEKNIGFLLSLAVVLFSFTLLLLTILSSKYTTKPILIIVLIISSFTSYFMNSYSVIIDDSMIRNILQTNFNESMDLLSIKQIVYFLLLGLLPSIFIYKSNIQYRSLKIELLSKLKTISIVLILIAISISLFSKHYTSFFREHKPLRYSTNPAYWIYSSAKYINNSFNTSTLVVKPIALDAKMNVNNKKKKIVIVVVGEAVRADHFSLNGYERETTPRLKKENIINFTNFSSCATTTAISVPCIFSSFGKEDFTYKKGISNENILDILHRTNKVSLLWRDNNSDSKGVALRVTYQDYKTSHNNTICIDGECRDEGMLVGLDKYIHQNREKNILIVLHQMGNHGPAYYKRYPKEFRKYKPECTTNQLEECSSDEITNAYDNAILYTDYFLSKTINFLKNYTNDFETTMLYISDHGESLGEKGMYLHGLPYFIAPDAQTHVASLIWSNRDISSLRKISGKHYSHDNIFDTLLGLFDIETKLYNKKMDIFNVIK